MLDPLTTIKNFSPLQTKTPPQRQSCAASSLWLESAFICLRHLHQQKKNCWCSLWSCLLPLLLPVPVFPLGSPGTPAPVLNGPSPDWNLPVMSELEQQQFICIHCERSTKICLEPTYYKVWSAPISSDTQQSNSNSAIRVTAISRAAAIVWHEIVSLVSNFDRQKLDLVMRAVKLHPASTWPGSRDVGSHRSQCHRVQISTMSVSRRTVPFSLWVYWKCVLFILSKAPSFWHESLAFLPSPSTLGELVCIVSDGRGKVFRFTG